MTDVPVGYGNPPAHTRFQTGKSGNPGGRPKKLPSLRSVLETELAAPIQVKEGGCEVTVSKQVALVKAIVAAALRGDQRAMTALFALARSIGTDEDENVDQVDQKVLDEYVERELQRRLTQTNLPEESR